jgi:hypothetical protein
MEVVVRKQRGGEISRFAAGNATYFFFQDAHREQNKRHTISL